jgi:zinc transport system substrate-binding protein
MDTSKKAVLRLMDAVSLVEEEKVEGMQEEEEGEAAAEEAEYDEHIWTSPKNAILMVNAITDALCAADAQNADYYKENAAAYIAKIEEVDKEFEAIVQSAPLKLMVFGDRFPFRYFADAYGLEYRAAFPGCSTETECSANTIAYLIDTVKENKLPYIYAIELSSQNIARSISEQTGAQVLTMQSCQSISRDDFEAGETYVSLMMKNAENLKKGLMAP